ncbi:hypothetical protein PHMEG_0006511 [Phytophthora megakarya]|uniref:Uncharacterized protein n=1 Tax=Phytophthora megakarya TaxID=4795 RepID=A0A225WNM1_9STRA|nr:hypothetical protein PHMEG_0006511 [Phytophthora megakarya]
MTVPSRIKKTSIWVKIGLRAFGLGQASVLSIRHIGFYMDVLMEQQEQGIGVMITRHQQQPGNQTIGRRS